MKAITYHQYGGPDELSVQDVPAPKVAPGEVRIAVRAAGVNPVDWKILAGSLDPLMEVQFPVIPGWDVAGVVESVGLDVPEVAVGDEVMAYARKDWVQHGALAELMTVPVRTLAPKPPSLSFAQAASVPLAGLTAYQTLHRLDVRSGTSVLLHGANGGVGTFAVQIARALGARVIGTASPANHDRLRALGAEPLAYGDGLADRVREIAPDGVDRVADLVGGVLETTLAVLAPGGRHASIADGSVAEHGGQSLWVRPQADDLARLGAMIEAGEIRVGDVRTYPLEETADAYRASMEGHTSGKIAVTIPQ